MNRKHRCDKCCEKRIISSYIKWTSLYTHDSAGYLFAGFVNCSVHGITSST